MLLLRPSMGARVLTEDKEPLRKNARKIMRQIVLFDGNALNVRL